MVRRWSYVNSINYKLSYRNTFKVRQGALDLFVNTYMYLDEDFSIPTHSFRKNWSRRKHMNQLSPLFNVLVSWAKEYRFYKNHSKMVHYQFFFKNTYLSVNLIIQRTPKVDVTKFSNLAESSSITKTQLTFFNKRFPNSRLHFLLSFRNNSWSYASYREHLTTEKILQDKSPYTPLYYDVKDSLNVVPDKPSVKSNFQSLLRTFRRLIFLKVKMYYSILTRLVLVQSLSKLK